MFGPQEVDRALLFVSADFLQDVGIRLFVYYKTYKYLKKNDGRIPQGRIERGKMHANRRNLNVKEEKKMDNFTFNRYPSYRQFCRWWELYLDSYEGGEEYLEAGYLFRHVKEDEDSFQDRIQRSYYYNFCRTVVDTYVAHIFRKSGAIHRNVDLADYQEILKDVDLMGNDMNTFMREQVAPAAQIFGHVHVLVDKPKVEEQPQSKAEQARLGIRPYLMLVYPQNLIDYRLDRLGNFLWARIEEPGPEEENPFYSPDAYSPDQYFYRTWTRTEWFLHNDRGQLLESGQHDLGRVPIVTVYNIESKKYARFGVSALADIAPINRSIYNWSSLNDEFLYRQCFNILAIPESPGSKRRKIGIGNALSYPIEASKAPHYIYPPVQPGEYLLKNIDSAIKQIYRLAVLAGPVATEAKRSQSGISKAYDFHEANQNLIKKAKNLEQAEVEIAKLCAAWEGVKDLSPIIEYPTDFNIESMADSLKAEFDLLRMNISDRFNKTVKKRIVTRYMKHDSRDLEKIFSEIEAAKEA